MEEMFRVINEFEARGEEVMFFNQSEFDIYEDETEDFKEHGYNVEYIGIEFIKNEGYIDVFSITKA